MAAGARSGRGGSRSSRRGRRISGDAGGGKRRSGRSLPASDRICPSAVTEQSRSDISIVLPCFTVQPLYVTTTRRENRSWGITRRR